MHSALTMALFVGAASAYTQTLSDCESVAALFDNTCGGTVMNTADIAGSTDRTLTCTGEESVCTAGTEGDKQATCTHNYSLCVTCSTIDSETYIRVQNNGLPNHCFT